MFPVSHPDPHPHPHIKRSQALCRCPPQPVSRHNSSWHSGEYSTSKRLERSQRTALKTLLVKRRSDEWESFLHSVVSWETVLFWLDFDLIFQRHLILSSCRIFPPINIFYDCFFNFLSNSKGVHRFINLRFRLQCFNMQKPLSHDDAELPSPALPSLASIVKMLKIIAGAFFQPERTRRRDQWRAWWDADWWLLWWIHPSTR